MDPITMTLATKVVAVLAPYVAVGLRLGTQRGSYDFGRC